MSSPALTLRPDIREGRFRFLSLGAGVQSTCLVLLDRYDEIIFADTGNELPETYDYVRDYIEPYCKKEHMKLTVVRNKTGMTLEQYYRSKGDIPNFVFRACTTDFKVKPIAEYLKASKIMLPAISVVGISMDEIERMKNTHPIEWLYEYLLVDRGMRRRDCEGVIKKQGWPVPPKSGCHFCMFNNKTRMRWIYANHPELWKQAKDFEQSARNYKNGAKLSIYGLTLEEIEQKMLGAGTQKLFADDDGWADSQSCDNGSCFV